MGNFADKVNFIWSVADLIRDHFKRGKYQDVILPFTVLRRIDCVLEPTRAKVREVNAKLQAKGLQNREPQLRKASGYAFYSTSLYDFDALLGSLPGTLRRDRSEFEEALGRAAKAAGVNLKAPVAKAIVAALSERDETAEICRDKDGNPDPDPDLRDTESVPLAESVETCFEREVRPHVPDAWINTAIRDAKDGLVGKVGYEVNFNRCFYKFQPPRPLEEIEADIRAVEKEILGMLGEVAG